MSKIQLDARRLLCPMPVIRLQDTVKNQPAGTLIEIDCSDIGVLHDIPAWCRINGHRVIHSEQQGQHITILVEVGENNE